MSTSMAFELTDHDMTTALSYILAPRLKEHILSRAPGHCMRVANLDLDLMQVLTRILRRECPGAQICILRQVLRQGLGQGPHPSKNGTSQDQEEGLFISSTKLVELRNPLPNGELRPPLLVFLPANLQASAEDSFSVATFEDHPVTDVYQVLFQRCMEQIPSQLQGHVRDLLAIPRSVWWPWADQVAQVRFLLTAIKNQVDGESLGASLYELGLVPDFRLFNDPALMQNRIRRNLESVRKLTHSDASICGRVLDLGLSDKTVQRRLIQFLSDLGSVEPTVWTRLIVTNIKQNRDISFDKWKFIDEINSDKISVHVTNLGIPRASEKDNDERLYDLNGQYVLNPAAQPKFSVTFQVDPHPTRVPSLDHFTVQILTQDGEPIGGAKRVKAWTTKKSEHTIQLDKLSKLEFEDGWHFVRVLPWTKDDEPVPLEAPPGDMDDERRRSHESEDFYVLLEGEVSELPPRAIPLAASFEHARLQVRFRELRELAEKRDPLASNVAHVLWMNKGSKSRQELNEVLEVKFERGGKFHINISRHLKALERDILTAPTSIVSWHWSIKAGKIEQESPIADVAQWPRSAAVESFLDARMSFCEAICMQMNDKEPIMQAVDLAQVKDWAIAYADAYRELLLDLARKIKQSRGIDQQKNILALRTVLTIDSVHVILTDFRGRAKEALLLAPTHPLRAIWFSTWTQVAQQWLTATSEGPDEYIQSARDALLSSLTPLNIPPTLPCTDGRVFTTVDNITPFWSLYATPTEEDTRGLLGELCASLGLSEPAISGDAITANVLVVRISRYLIQHPYIRTLSINAFNPGRATVLAEAIAQLQKTDSFAQLRYDIRLFVPDPTMPHVGDALEALLSPDTTINNETSDTFALPGRSHLFPKLSLAIHPLAAFHDQPSHYRAHLSLLFDLFPAEEIAAGPAFHLTDTSSVHGLVQDFASRFYDGEDGTFWQRQPCHGKAQSLAEIDAAVDILAELSSIISGAVATVATGVEAFEQRPIITVSLNTALRELIHYVHDISDWVLTIDRHIDIEFFDHGGRSDRPEYLIDYIPGSSSEQGHKLITTSRTFLELEATLKPLMEQRSLPANHSSTRLILDQLRALSGRLALKLISSSTHQKETLGLALARLFLIEQGALANQIILPLDVHLDLIQAVKRTEEDLGAMVTLQRTDLALFDLNATTRTIRCNLIEVKCYNHVGGPSAYARLREEIAEQIEKSEHVLRHHFDTTRKFPDRPDRLLKTRELRILLEFYLGRSERHGLMQPEATEEARLLLATLESGYKLEFTRSALIFDFEQPSTDAQEIEQEIEFYHIGQDQITALITLANPSVSNEERESILSSGTVPHWPTAAFVVSRRENSVSHAQSQVHHHIEEQENDATDLAEDLGSCTADRACSVRPYDHADEAAFDIPPARNEAHDTLLHHQFVEEPLYTAELAEHKPNLVKESQIAEKDIVPSNQPSYSVVLGIQSKTPQYGILGEIGSKKVALDLNQTHTISLFGVQGSGKSYTLGSIVEMASLSIPNINVLPAPLATVIFHYSPTQDYKPEFTSMIAPNTDPGQAARLREQYGASPQALRDIILLVPVAKLEERKREYPDIEVQPITFAASELKAIHWKFLMGAIGSQSIYIREMNLMMKLLRDKLTLEGLQQEIANSTMAERLKKLAQDRLRFAAEYIDDSRKVSNLIRPGRLIIVDVRDEFIEKDEALGLFVVLLQIFSEATYQGKTFNKLVVFDEAHKYIENDDLVAGLIEIVREMRHKGTSIMVASQDPPSVPVSLIELSSHIILHRCNSPAWLKHIQKANTSLNSLTPEKMSRLGAGEAYIWSAKASDDGFTKNAVKIKLRPRVTRHGGDTKTAVV